MAEAAGPLVEVLDDGELDGVRAVLGELGVACREESSGGRALLRITNARRASAAHELPPCRTHIVVADDVSRTLGRMLERSSCDFLVKGPVHPVALRLLIASALYQGEGRRRAPRVALGLPIRIRLGRRSVSALLAQLSQQGCGVVTRAALETAARLSVVLPPELTGAEALELRARPVGRREVRTAGRSQFETALVFESVDARERKLLRASMQGAAVGGAPLSPDAERAIATPRTALAPAARAAGSTRKRSAGASCETERRASPRKRYHQQLLATACGSAESLLGLDLSTGGMRVVAHPKLALGDELKLALYGTSRTDPVIVKAVVARDDGRRGWILRFRGVSPTTRARLEALLQSLPVEASPQRGGSAVVVSEIVSRDPG